MQISPRFLTIFYCLLYSILNVSGAALIKLKLKGQVLTAFKDWFEFLLNIQVIVAFVLIFTSALVMFKALSSSAFSFTVPIATGINFALTLIAGYFIFKDQLNGLSFIGFTLILSGIIILSLNNVQQAH
jgi:multidrug transporter EmrE-like cation transporter